MNYNKLFLYLEEHSIRRTSLVDWGIVNPCTMQNLLHNGCVSLHSLEEICAFLDCGIDDITEVTLEKS